MQIYIFWMIEMCMNFSFYHLRLWIFWHPVLRLYKARTSNFARNPLSSIARSTFRDLIWNNMYSCIALDMIYYFTQQIARNILEMSNSLIYYWVCWQVFLDYISKKLYLKSFYHSYSEISIYSTDILPRFEAMIVYDLLS